MVLKDNTSRYPLFTLDSFNCLKSVPTAFAGATTDARGDLEGASQGILDLFLITGDVEVGVYGVCPIDLEGAGNISLGVNLGIDGAGTVFIPSTTVANIDQYDLWMDTSPSTAKAIDSLNFWILGTGTSGGQVDQVPIAEHTLDNDITAGNIEYVCLWRPLSQGSIVTSYYPA